MLKDSEVKKLIAYEELFFDELNHKVDSIFLLYKLDNNFIKEVESFSEQLEDLTEENIKLLKKYE